MRETGQKVQQISWVVGVFYYRICFLLCFSLSLFFVTWEIIECVDQQEEGINRDGLKK